MSVRYRRLINSAGEDVSKWVADYKKWDGKRAIKTFDTKAKAVSFHSKVKKDPHYAEKLRPLTINDVCERFLRINEQRQRDGEITRSYVSQQCATFENYISPLIGAMPAREMRPRDVAAWIEGLRNDKRRQCSPGTLRRAVDLLRSALTESQRLELLERNVIKDVPPRLPARKTASTEILTKPEINKILSSAEGLDRVVVSLAIFTGMRIGEIMGLRWSNVDLTNRLIKVDAIIDAYGDLQIRTKTKAGKRTIPISERMSRILKEWKIEHINNSLDLLFISPRMGYKNRKRVHRALTAQSYHSKWKALLRKAGIQKQGETNRTRFHDLRHVAASLFIEQGLPPKRIQQLMGHSSITMTFDRYGHLFSDDGQGHRATEAIDQQFEGK